MEDEKKIAENATSQAESLLGQASRIGNVNPLQKSALVAGKYKIEGIVTQESGEPMAGVSIGLAGQEAVTDDAGKFELVIEKKP